MSSGVLQSINVGQPRAVVHDGRLITTAIFKTPVSGSVMLHRTHVAGDAQADLEVHGGEDKAVYACAKETHEFWERELSRDDFTPGQFGENLTTGGLTDDQVCVGDVYDVGEAQVQVTQPRAPCGKLNLRMNDATFIKRFLGTCRVGFYLRVLREGAVAAGDTFALIRRDPNGFPIEQVCRLRYFDQQNHDAIRRVLKVDGLSSAWRESLANLLGEK